MESIFILALAGIAVLLSLICIAQSRHLQMLQDDQRRVVQEVRRQERLCFVAIRDGLMTLIPKSHRRFGVDLGSVVDLTPDDFNPMTAVRNYLRDHRIQNSDGDDTWPLVP